MAQCKCKSSRIASIAAKSKDLNLISIAGKESDGYVPRDMGIGGGDYVRFSWCLDCGQIQSTIFPLDETKLELGERWDYT